MAVIPAPDYAVLGQETAPYELQLAEILARLPGEKVWFQLGDCDSFKVDIVVTKKSREAKRGRVKETAIEVVESIKTSVSIKAMQFCEQVRGAAFLGDVIYFTQAEVTAGSYEAGVLKAGIYYIETEDGKPVYDVTAANIADATLDEHYKIVDAAAGGIQVFEDCPGIGAEAVITYEAAEITAADKRPRVDVGSKPEFKLELKARGTSINGTPAEIHLYLANLAPNGGVEQLSDDFASVELTGACVRTNRGVGTWQKLAA